MHNPLNTLWKEKANSNLRWSNRSVLVITFCLSVLIPIQSIAQQVITVAGRLELAGDIDGDPLNGAMFSNPHGIACDKFGRVYIADRWNHKIRVLDTRRDTVYTLAGNGTIGREDGPGSVARFYSPWGIACDSVGNVYVADTKNYLIRKIDTLGIVSTVAGTGSFGVANGPSSVARFADPTGITVTPDGTVYVCDHLAHTIRRISTSGNVSTIAGTAFLEGDDDGTGSQARFYRPYGIELDHDGSILVADEWNHKIRRVQPDGTTTTVAGSGFIGSQDGDSLVADFNFPWDLVALPDGGIYVMDGYNHTMRQIQNGVVTTFIGEPGTQGGTDGYGVDASFSGATALCYSVPDEAIYVGDAFNNLIRKVTFVPAVILEADSISEGDSICLGEHVRFFASPDTFDQYEFVVNGESKATSSSRQFSWIFEESGIQAVVVKAYKGAVLSSESNPFRFIVNPGVDAGFTHTQQTVPTGVQVFFSPNYPFASAYEWDFGDPLSGAANSSFTPNPLHVYETFGSFSVTLTTTSHLGCLQSKTQTISVSPLRITTEPELQMTGDTICTATEVSFLAAEGAGLFSQYRWIVNGDTIQRGSDSTWTTQWDSVGCYNISVIGSGNDGDATTTPFELCVVPQPIAAFSHQQTELPSGMHEVQFINESENASTYFWDFGDSNLAAQDTSSEFNPEYIYESNASFQARLIAFSEHGCADTTYETLRLGNLDWHVENQAGTILNSGDSICVGDELTLVADSAGFDSYSFFQDGFLLQRSPDSFFVINFPTVGTFEFEVRGETSTGDTLFGRIFQVVAIPNPEATFSTDETMLANGSLQVDFSAVGALSWNYLWDFGDPASGLLNTGSGTFVSHTYEAYGAYTVILIAQASARCQDTLMQVDAVQHQAEQANLFIPSAFSPNNDGENDVLRVRGNNIDRLDFRVYNEWGQMIFRSENPAIGWDGTFEGSAVATDSYLYVATITLFDGSRHTLTGITTLLR
ncbi:PKD domain-containing protein [Pontibacter sp. G13]|uniref:PKD domain-containing protein n=1 Tax=Pontibacter sp. G13 TaxID=3074898 RepID=UPI00288B04B4|nr:PKD domain-containing protein [Pontibacter sp. G13]WNJ18923.1 PKD domain-containing protein [Pontibacter sp. G13]